MRIVSLLPSATEIVCALGLQEQLVGVTFECDYPPDPRLNRAVVVGGLETHGLSTREIDDLVRQKVASGNEMYQLDVAKFRTLDADLVLTQDLCRVCALPGDQVEQALVTLGCDAQVITLDPHSLSDIFATIIAVGDATQTSGAADELVRTLSLRLDRVRRAAELNLDGNPPPKVFVLEWPDPPFVAGHWVPELVIAAGGEPVLSRIGERSVPTTWEAIGEAQPEVVIVASCGFDTNGTASHAVEALGNLPKNCSVWAIDADGLIVRPGPRVVDGVETLAAILRDAGNVPTGSAVRIR